MELNALGLPGLTYLNVEVQYGLKPEACALEFPIDAEIFFVVSRSTLHSMARYILLCYYRTVNWIQSSLQYSLLHFKKETSDGNQYEHIHCSLCSTLAG